MQREVSVDELRKIYPNIPEEVFAAFIKDCEEYSSLPDLVDRIDWVFGRIMALTLSVIQKANAENAAWDKSLSRMARGKTP